MEKEENKKPETSIQVLPSVEMSSRGFEPKNIEQAWRFANALARSELVPAQYKDKPDDCLIVLDLASRLGVHWLTIMQNVYVVHGRPAMEAKLITALINKSGLFTDPLDYEVEGTDAKAPEYRVRAFAKRKRTGKTLHGPWIDWKIVKGEQWDKKAGSKWLTMPEQMFHYRAASWFKNRHCPEVAMGMMTTDEATEIETKHIESFEVTQKNASETIEKETGSQQIVPSFDEQPSNNDLPPAEGERTPEQQAKIDAEKEKLNSTSGKTRTKKKNTTRKKPDSKYICRNCQSKKRPFKFDTPLMSGPEGRQTPICPNKECLSTNIVETKDLPEFMTDD